MKLAWREGGRAGTLAGFALAHVFIFAVLFRTVYNTPFTGTGLFYSDAAKVLAGQVPYRDFALEYPPLALAFFTLPRLNGASFADYYIGWQIQVVICDLVVLLLLDAIARRSNQRAAIVLGGYTLMVLAIGPIVFQQYDLFPAAMTLAAIYAFQRGRTTAGWIALTAGVLTKVYPLLLFPLFAAPAWRARDRRAVLRAAFAVAATLLVVVLPLLVLAPTSLVSMIAYHTERGIHMESLYGGLLLAADKLHLTHVGLYNRFGAWQVTGSAPDVLVPLSTVLLLAALALAYRHIWRQAAHHATGAALVITTAMVASKVLSPQYLIWLAPLLPLVDRRRRRSVWALFAAIGLASYYIFPLNADRLVYTNDGVVITVLVLRNLLLAVLAFLLARSFAPDAPPQAAT
jgi:uncharacterized membrane protein